MVSAIITDDISDDELAQGVEENLYDLFRAMAANLASSALEESDKLSRHLTFPLNPMFSGVWRTRLTPDEVENQITETIAWFEQRNAPFFYWWAEATSTPDDLGQRLAARGMKAIEDPSLAAGIKPTNLGAPCMVATLNRMNEAVLNQLPADFVIETVQDDRGLLDFKRVFTEGYEIPDWAGQAWVDATQDIGIGRTPWKMYIGKLGGKPVATNMVFAGGGVAGVYAVATIPAVRGKGIGSAITLKPLLEAREIGYRYSVLFATEMGVPVYKRLGFRLTPVKINRYLWRKST